MSCGCTISPADPHRHPQLIQQTGYADVCKFAQEHSFMLTSKQTFMGLLISILPISNSSTQTI